MVIHNVFPGRYQQQLDEKVASFTAAIRSLNIIEPLPELAIYTSPKQHYRMRAEFKVWHQDGVAHYAMTDPDTKKPVFIEQFPVAAEPINQLMPELLATINQNETLRKKLFQIEFLTTLTNDTLVTLIYHKPLDDHWIDQVTPLKQQFGIHFIGRSRKQKIVLDREYVNECLTVNDKPYRYRQIEGSFTQPNARVCEKMLSWAVVQSQNMGGDLLELYCGNGNFTLPLAANFNRVMATEIAKASVQAALHNIADNGIDNIAIARMSSEDFVQALDKVRPFRRLKEIDLDDYHFSTVFVDPPRAGLDADTVRMIQRFDNIIYISCNPETLIDNLAILSQTHSIAAQAVFDQFPYTPHLEAGVILSKR